MPKRGADEKRLGLELALKRKKATVKTWMTVAFGNLQGLQGEFARCLASFAQFAGGNRLPSIGPRAFPCELLTTTAACTVIVATRHSSRPAKLD
ncbi:MAG: hypothetical protein DMG06_22985 [Acidobacteria bacterium]|nr:MAG: hypothetical protein DMG06_22985 [Acidobacteriota bacterium]